MLRGKILLLAALPILSLIGCIGGPDAPDFEAARARWEKNRPALYAYTVTHLCLCPPGGPVHVVASRDSVLEATMEGHTPMGTAIDVPSPQAYSIEALFDKVDALSQRRHKSRGVSFDPTYGFPASAYIDFGKREVDEEYHLEISDFRPVSGVP